MLALIGSFTHDVAVDAFAFRRGACLNQIVQSTLLPIERVLAEGVGTKASEGWRGNMMYINTIHAVARPSSSSSSSSSSSPSLHLSLSSSQIILDPSTLPSPPTPSPWPTKLPRLTSAPSSTSSPPMTSRRLQATRKPSPPRSPRNTASPRTRLRNKSRRVSLANK
ncbi:uncharacterized protein PV07_11212 [Cladophialophora immunda]|uniref:Uncharacterized protein n=1 Tax=Cladophialophora immunda TaxID=569365 RepID=A0A0D2ADL2_9EURO|nr:uncharacterized protein PV07_11212 [Cladophialophora immunda]KIW22972.1 hypothetical protein PV07_11212 [Cladophialophora immunda]